MQSDCTKYVLYVLQWAVYEHTSCWNRSTYQLKFGLLFSYLLQCSSLVTWPGVNHTRHYAPVVAEWWKKNFQTRTECFSANALHQPLSEVSSCRRTRRFLPCLIVITKFHRSAESMASERLIFICWSMVRETVRRKSNVWICLKRCWRFVLVLLNQPDFIYIAAMWLNKIRKK